MNTKSSLLVASNWEARDGHFSCSFYASHAASLPLGSHACIISSCSYVVSAEKKAVEHSPNGEFTAQLDFPRQAGSLAFLISTKS